MNSKLRLNRCAYSIFIYQYCMTNILVFYTVAPSNLVRAVQYIEGSRLLVVVLKAPVQ